MLRLLPDTHTSVWWGNPWSTDDPLGQWTPITPQ